MGGFALLVACFISGRYHAPCVSSFTPARTHAVRVRVRVSKSRQTSSGPSRQEFDTALVRCKKCVFALQRDRIQRDAPVKSSEIEHTAAWHPFLISSVQRESRRTHLTRVELHLVRWRSLCRCIRSVIRFAVKEYPDHIWVKAGKRLALTAGAGYRPNTVPEPRRISFPSEHDAVPRTVWHICCASQTEASPMASANNNWKARN
ncbi:hypothetical protein B0T26DRAFT_83827 [Lasiosphaeria miniovina]|uniref:Secreted protein n=1 Tax=Lasiosphaeria miniovina TaxID=1954250 RepID=A0AA40BIR0_9PEZI|nr:uncharacterized protein B0T26DRAFT_83827 [Lasiosphaeria miniovina]KAK0734858.1 hypothetical protein B0T26DRAFT_83827 [Lasiosphaeria miniovina]